MRVHRLRAPHADVFIADEDGSDRFDYHYGGTRCVHPATSDDAVLDELNRLQRDESGLKNALINVAVRQGALAHFNPGRLPFNFLRSRIGGARCILRPADKATAHAIADGSGDELEATIRPVFAQLGDYLNNANGRIKLTPDFGRYAGLADLLYHHTPHVLGIRCDRGGCGGKASYSTTGVIAAFEALGCHRGRAPVTLIGSAGAMGSGFLSYLINARFQDVAVCDLAYDRKDIPAPIPSRATHLESVEGRFTHDCLARGGGIVATTLGRELENSPWELLPPGTVLLLAHNLAIPRGEDGVRLMREIQSRGVTAYPGQVLTLGGALTSRLEWYWRQGRPGVPFDKPMAHEVVRAVVSFLMHRIEVKCHSSSMTPLEAMHRIAGEDRPS
jgi:hypothetical protein